MKLDFVVFYATVDEDRALSISTKIKSYGFSGVLYNDTKSIDQACDMTRHVLICVSNNIVDDKFLEMKNLIVKKWINGKCFCLIPVYLERKRDLHDTTMEYMYGLLSLNGFHPNSKYFEEDVKKQFLHTLNKTASHE